MQYYNPYNPVWIVGNFTNKARFHDSKNGEFVLQVIGENHRI